MGIHWFGHTRHARPQGFTFALRGPPAPPTLPPDDQQPAPGASHGRVARFWGPSTCIRGVPGGTSAGFHTGAKVLALRSNAPVVRASENEAGASCCHDGEAPCLRTDTVARSAARFSSMSNTSPSMKLPTCVARNAAMKPSCTSRRNSSRRRPRRARSSGPWHELPAQRLETARGRGEPSANVRNARWREAASGRIQLAPLGQRAFVRPQRAGAPVRSAAP